MIKKYKSSLEYPFWDDTTKPDMNTPFMKKIAKIWKESIKQKKKYKILDKNTL